MKNMLEEVDCNLCKGNNIDVVFESTVQNDTNDNFECSCTNNGHGEHYRVVKCKSCGLVYCSPRNNSEDIKDKYIGVRDDLYLKELEGRKRTFRRNLRNLNKYKKTGKLIDIGCSIGVFLNLAKNDGWQIKGIEPSKWCVEQSKELFDLDVMQGTYKDITEINEKYDVITMWDVLEHLDDPLQALKVCNKALRDDGILACSTVNIGCVYARILGEKWPWLMKMHIYYFDRKTIKKYFEKAGFEIIKISSYVHIISLDYLIYKLNKINRFLFYLVKSLTCSRLFNKGVYVPVSLGDFMEIYAVKRLEV